MNLLQEQYILMAAPRLSVFARKSGNLFNFRCPQCGDSARKKKKARGYLYLKKGEYFYHCFNCDVNLTFKTFLKMLDPALYNQYLVDIVRERDNQPLWVDAPVQVKAKVDDLVPISRLPSRHKAYQYVEQRLIPERWWDRIFYVERFKEFTNKQLPKKFENGPDEDRLVIPFNDIDGNMIGYVGRSFEPDAPVKYITIMLDETKDKYWGLDTCDFNRRYFVVEGPIDAMFLDNAVACAQGHLRAPHVPHNAVMVSDNEPRNRQIVTMFERLVKDDLAVVIWPPDHPFKDINDMRKGGFHESQISSFLDEHTYRGLRAELEFKKWRKC